MSNYTQNVSYGPKDALTTGDAAKRIKGVEIDAEFAEIATAISSKEDTANKGAANGYCGLDAGGLVVKADLPASVVYNDAAAALGSTLSVAGATTLAAMSATTGAFSSNTTVGGTLNVTGTLTGAAGAFTSMTISGVSVLTTSSGLNASNINAGSIGAAYVPVGAVTQHQASLSIAESQIADGAVFGRLGSTETVTGAWSFAAMGASTITGALTRSTMGSHPYFGSSTQNSGKITLSTSAASGTPGAGDIWIQYTA
jgi:hypothetical protein